MTIEKIVPFEIIDKLIKESGVYIILDELNIKVLDKIKLISNNRVIVAKVTSVRRFDSIDEILGCFDYRDFGYFESLEKFIDYYKKTTQNKQLLVCKVKNVTSDEVIISNEEILSLIDMDEKFEQNNVGFSLSKIIKLKLKDGNNAILKINSKTNEVSLEREYIRMKWLSDKLKCPKIFMWKSDKDKEYLLMECMEGQNAYMYNNIGYKLGQELRNIHNIAIGNCEFDDYSPENLLERAKKRIDFALPELLSCYPNETKDSIITFLEINKPKDKAFTHGDYSLPNIIVNEKNNQYSFIDLGQAGISTKYLDLFCAIKSFKMNHLEKEISDFLEGYGIEELDEDIMRWMEIIDKIL